MSSIGQKIKDALTGHHESENNSDVKTPDVNAPGAFPSDEFSTKNHGDHNKLTKEAPGQTQQHIADEERGALHHTGHAHHDPEPETKQATSEAGNYPYWGDLPREGGEHVHRAGEPTTGVTEQHHGISKETGAMAAGAGAGAAGAGYLASKHLKGEDTTRTNEETRSEAVRDTKLDDKDRNTNRGTEAAAVTGTTYLVTRDKDYVDNPNDKKSTTSATPAQSQTSKTTQATETSTATQKPVEAATPTKTTSGRDNDSHRKEEEAIAAGAGAAGIAGAGYHAHKKGDKEDQPRDVANQGTQAHSSQTSHPTTTSTTRHDPVTETQKATSAAGNYPYWNNSQVGSQPTTTSTATAATPSKTTSSGDNDTHRREEQALAAGAGATGLAGAGYLASKKHDDHKDEKQTSQTPSQSVSGAQTSGIGHQTHSTTNPRDPEDEAKRATSGAGNYPHWGSDSHDHDKNRDLAAAGVGGAGLAGAGLLASNRADEHKDHPGNTTRETTVGSAAPTSLAQRDTTARQADPSTSGGIHNTVVGAGSSEYTPPTGSTTTTTTGDGHQTQPPTHQSQPAAQAAARQAWNQHETTSSNTVDDTSKDNKRSELGYAAAGTALGAGAAGLAANYGQGKEHENNPRTKESEKVADRALGSDGKPHAPSSTEGVGSGSGNSAPSGLTSGGSGLSGQSASSGIGPKVFHKCENCGHDNDISRYFSKDATFRSQQ
ncbi:hypothetical protein diail_2625 [Diaporthe ilicicola]|nr:hypothetical protein diail_2625 [Diaporthe ilicicola]